MTEPPVKNVHQAVLDVMEEITHIAKNSVNAQQGFNFRGIEDVMNVVGPLLRKHRLLVRQSEVKDSQAVRYETRAGGTMLNVVVTVIFEWIGPDGSTMVCETVGEAADAGDKATTKAQSVAKRIMLIDTLNIPTAGVVDPDSQSHERASTRTDTQRPTVTRPALSPGNRPGPTGARTSGREWEKEIAATTDAEVLRNLYREINTLGEMSDPLKQALTARATAIDAESRNQQANKAARSVRARASSNGKAPAAV